MSYIQPSGSADRIRKTWVWTDSAHLEKALGWHHRPAGQLRTWLKENGYLDSEPKPTRPKEALGAALREVKKPFSAAIFRSLAECVSLDRCSDAAFLKLRDTLRAWFGDSAPTSVRT